jgi:hypothetical protein
MTLIEEIRRAANELHVISTIGYPRAEGDNFVFCERIAVQGVHQQEAFPDLGRGRIYESARGDTRRSYLLKGNIHPRRRVIAAAVKEEEGGPKSGGGEYGQ